MLKTTAMSTAKKTAGCAVTYRAGSSEKFGTCPASCELNPSGTGCSDGQIDFDYLDAVLDAKPRRGFSFTYSHFHPLFWSLQVELGKNRDQLQRRHPRRGRAGTRSRPDRHRR